MGAVTLQRSRRAESERCRIENDTLRSRTQKARGLEPLSRSGTKLMRLFLSPPVKVYYLYFKGSGQQRGWGEALFLPRTGVGNGRCWLGERVGGCPCLFATKRARPHGARSWMHAPVMISSWQWSQGGRKMDRGED